MPVSVCKDKCDILIWSLDILKVFYPNYNKGIGSLLNMAVIVCP